MCIFYAQTFFIFTRIYGHISGVSYLSPKSLRERTTHFTKCLWFTSQGFWWTDFLYTTVLDTRKSKSPQWSEAPKSPYGPGVIKSSMVWGIKSLLATAITFQMRTPTTISTSVSGSPDRWGRGFKRVTQLLPGIRALSCGNERLKGKSLVSRAHILLTFSERMVGPWNRGEPFHDDVHHETPV